MADSKVHGRFIWQELMTLDPKAASAFYSKILGWTAKPFREGESYLVFSTADGGVGGLMELPEDARKMGARPHWLPYVGAYDVDATVTEAQRLGARVFKGSTDIEGVGRIAVLADPQGALFGLFSPAAGGGSGPGPGAAPGPAKAGQFAWRELATSDAEAAYDFYRQLFGWDVLQRMDMGAAGTYLIFGWDGVQRGGIYKRGPEQATRPPAWLAYTEVADADKTAAAATAAGARVLQGPMDVPGGGRIAQLEDPEGVTFAVHRQAKAPAAAPKPAPKPAAPPPKPPTLKPAAQPPTLKPAAAAPKPPAAPAPAPKPAAAAPAPKPAPAPAKSAAKKTAPAKKAAPAKKKAKKKAKKVAKKVAKKAAKKAKRAQHAAPSRAKRAGKSAKKKIRARAKRRPARKK